MDRNELKNRILSFIRKYRYPLLVLVIGIALMLIPGNKTEKQSEIPEKQAVQLPGIEERLEEILSKIDGAGKVSVMVSEAAGETVIYQQDEDVALDGSGQRDTVIVTDENRAQSGLIQQIISPQYQGVIVVCQGAGKASIRLSIIEAVARVTGLGTDRISVLKMK